MISASARSAFPRWLIRSFSSALICAVVTLEAVRHEDGVVPEAVAAARRAGQLAAHRALGQVLAPRGQHQRRHAHEPRPPLTGRDVRELAEQQPQVGLVIPVRPGPAGRQHTGHPVQRVHAEPGVVGHRGEPGERGHRPGLQQCVPGEGRARSRPPRACRGHPRGRSTAALTPAAARILRSSASLPGFRVARMILAGPVDAGPRHRPSASRCSRVRSAQPATARSSSRSSRSRSNGSRSAVPWTSTNLPSPVHTTFMSVWAATSSS